MYEIVSLPHKGQRKALFEDCEAERKANIEEISKLKKENTDLVTSLHEYSSSTAKLDIQKRKIEFLIGPIENKEGGEVHELLDLQLIDKSKQLDLLRYHIKERRNHLSKLGKKYQILLSEQAKRDAILKVDVPVKKTVCEIQNSIHAVEVQLREAEHIKSRYQSIRNSLSDDAAKFESKIKKIEEDLQAQKTEIHNLQQILQIAVKMKNSARRVLVLEEREAVSSAKQRETQLDEGRRLVTARKAELESLEKKIYQSGKLTARPEPEGAEEITNQLDNDKSESTICPLNDLEKSFETLKAATGAPTAEKTLEKFSVQRDTLNRLEALRAKAETQKEKLEKKIERRAAELEYQKYAQVKDIEKTSGEAERNNKLLQELHQRTKIYKESTNQSNAMILTILAGLRKLYMHINPTGIIYEEPLVILENIKKESEKLIHSCRGPAEHLSTKDENISDDKWLPTPYIKLISKTPISQQGTPAPPPGSDEEEEVPSRGHLKRQAQIVVDARSRRKNIKMQLPKRL
ncbi:hypothetical protein WA026_022676 [Henosepilachna vigintioctopunctata]|uniref:Coiled-coil domain-containing protein 151 n=1 Tax=Henosepilachna vigintioctopunctata TaxID=420089 RepID=A0AAW1TSX9_9CUCU